MAINIQQGQTETIKLKFTDASGLAVSAPTSGGSVAVQNTNLAVATLGNDQMTVTIQAVSLGSTVVTYSGPQGLTVTDALNILATTATNVVFDETTLTVGG